MAAHTLTDAAFAQAEQPDTLPIPTKTTAECALEIIPPVARMLPIAMTTMPAPTIIVKTGFAHTPLFRVMTMTVAPWIIAQTELASTHHMTATITFPAPRISARAVNAGTH